MQNFKTALECRFRVFLFRRFYSGQTYRHFVFLFLFPNRDIFSFAYRILSAALFSVGVCLPFVFGSNSLFRTRRFAFHLFLIFLRCSSLEGLVICNVQMFAEVFCAPFFFRFKRENFVTLISRCRIYPTVWYRHAP